MMTTRVIRRAMLLLLCLGTATLAQAQDFRIKKFEQNMLDLAAARAGVKDNNGDLTALIKVTVNDKKFQFEPNMGIVRQQQKVGEVWLFVPQKTKRLTIRHPQLGVLRDYVIPVEIEQKMVYNCEIEITNRDYLKSMLESRTDTVRIEVTKEVTVIKEKERPFRVSIGAGFNVMSIMGPTAYLGFNLRQHSVEAGVTMGMAKVEGVSLYQNDNGVFWGTYDYKPLRIFARYGYDISAGPVILTPQAGVAFNNINGDEMRRASSGGSLFSKTHAVSATVGCRISYPLGKNFRVQVTPEYDIAVKKSKGFKVIEQADTKIKSWASGININAGLAIYF